MRRRIHRSAPDLRFAARWRAAASGYLRDFDVAYDGFKAALELQETLPRNHDDVILAVYTYGDVDLKARLRHRSRSARDALNRQARAPQGSIERAKIGQTRSARKPNRRPVPGLMHLPAVQLHGTLAKEPTLIAAKTYSSLGDHKRRQTESSRHTLKAALKMCQAIEPNGYLRVRVLFGLGMSYERGGQPQAAIAPYGEALRRVREYWPKSDKRMAVALNNLALAQLKSGAHGEAELNYTKALALFEKAYGEDHLNVATVVHSLGEVYMHKGNLPKAVQSLNRALAIRTKRLGPKHPKVAIVVGTSR